MVKKSTKSDSFYISPDHLHSKAKVQMDEIYSILIKEKGIKRQDSSALYILADCYSLYYQAMDILKRDGIVQEEAANAIQQSLPGMEPAFIQKMRVTKAHPALKIATDAQYQITKLLIEFNLTPKARKKTDVPIPEPPSPADKFIKDKVETR